MSDVQASTETSAVERTQIAAQPPAATSETPAAAEDRPPRGKVVRILTIVAVVMGLLFIWKVFFASPSLPASIVALSGCIEGDDSAVAPKTSGKILEITVREDDSVTAGQVIARLDDTQIRAQAQAARAALLDAQAKALSATEQIHVLQSSCTKINYKPANRKPMPQAACGRRRPISPPVKPTSRSNKRRSSSPNSIAMRT